MTTSTPLYRRILKYVLGFIVVLAVLGVIGSMAGWFGNGDRNMPVEMQAVEQRDITRVVTAFGRIQPEVEVKISPDVSGEIVELNVQEGDYVQQGDLLAGIRPDFYASQVDQAEASLKQAQATLAQRRADLRQAEAELKRQQQLHEREVSSGADLESAQTTYDVAEATYQAAQYSVESAQARLKEAGDELSKTRIFAPMDGTVSMLEIELGERVVGTMQQAGTEMMRIARLDRMEIEVDVNENDVVNVSMNDTARVEVDAHPDRLFAGLVTEIANSARISGEGTQEQVTNFPVKIRLTDAENIIDAENGSNGDRTIPEHGEELASPRSLVFRPGMSGTVEIFTQQVQDAISVPIQAVTVRERSADDRDEDDNGSMQQVIFVVGPENRAEMIEVETGIADDTYIEIRSGLTGSERVITGPYQAVSRELTDGALVNEQSSRW